MRKHSKNSLLRSLSIACLLFFVNDAFAQVKTITSCSSGSNDTLSRRMLKGILADSTQFNFGAGPYALKQPSIYTYLSFQSVTVGPAAVKSSTFISDGSFDTVSISRLMYFDDRNQVEISGTESSPPTQALIDSASNKQVIPNPYLFGSSSSILYIDELRNASNDAVLDRFDTLNCYLNSSGALRYSVSGCSPIRQTFSLPQSSNNDTVYLAVEVIPSLPVGSSLTYYVDDLTGGPPPFTGALYGIRQECNGAPATKSAALSPASTAMAGIPVDMIHGHMVGFDPSTSTVNFNLTVANSGNIEATLYDILGKAVSSRVFSVTPGVNYLHLQVSQPVNGPYYLLINDNGVTKRSLPVTINR